MKGTKRLSEMERSLFPLLLILFGAQVSLAFTVSVFKRRHVTHFAVSKKDTYNIALLKGDGIGPEISDATVTVLSSLQEKAGFTINFTPALIGGAALDETDEAFPDASLETCRGSDSVLLACIGGYKWDNNSRDKRPETGLLRMRKEVSILAFGWLLPKNRVLKGYISFPNISLSARLLTLTLKLTHNTQKKNATRKTQHATHIDGSFCKPSAR